MQLNPARGRKLVEGFVCIESLIHRFMQLNPARGRKPLQCVSCICEICNLVYAAQPREGTETRYHVPRGRNLLS